MARHNDPIRPILQHFSQNFEGISQRGAFNGQPRFATTGVEAQAYVPLVTGPLGRAGFYDGLPAGPLSQADRERVELRRQAWLQELGGEVIPAAERAARPPP